MDISETELWSKHSIYLPEMGMILNQLIFSDFDFKSSEISMILISLSVILNPR